MPAVSNEKHDYLTRTEVLRLARMIKDRPTRAWVLLTFATGSRPGELYRSTPTPAGMLLPMQKNGQRELKPVLPRFARYMRHWPLPHHYSWHSRVFRAAARHLGLKITPHGLRHSTASALASCGATLLQVGRVLGHKSLQATNRYAHLYADERTRLLESIWQKRPHKARSS